MAPRAMPALAAGERVVLVGGAEEVEGEGAVVFTGAGWWAVELELEAAVAGSVVGVGVWLVVAGLEGCALQVVGRAAALEVTCKGSLLEP